MDLATARTIMHEFVNADKTFTMSGPEGFEDLAALSPETDTRYFRQIEMTEYGLGRFGLLLYVYSQELDKSVIYSSKFEKLIGKSAKAYDKQNVKLAREDKKFFLGVGLLDEGTDLLRVLATFAKLTLGVSQFEEYLNKKLKLSLVTKH